jgi:C-terminal processing protease CtpA/Prc
LQILSTAWQGLLGDWNVDNPQQRVKPGDRIVQVNGRSAADEIIAECHKSHMLCFVMERAAKTSQAHPTHRQWNIELVRVGEEALGLTLDRRSSKVLAVAWHGLLGDWNINNQSHQVKPGDRIVKVNGRSAIEGIIDECQNSHVLRCLRERETCTIPAPVSVQPWTIEIERSSEECLGINLDKHSLQILSIAWQGALGAWNVGNPMHSVKPGDKIVRVNGSVSADDIILQCQMMTSLSIDIVREP